MDLLHLLTPETRKRVEHLIDARKVVREAKADLIRHLEDEVGTGVPGAEDLLRFYEAITGDF